MSPTLKAFLQAYADWAYHDQPNFYGFDPSLGLCSATIRYALHQDISFVGLRHELEGEFLDDGLDITYPFGEDDFNNRDDLRTCPKRRAWVLAKLEADI